MRLWSIHPEYLDRQGLLALWREGLLARKVLRGETCGYRRHPQLERFRAQQDPIASINAYLRFVHDEAVRRGYCFDLTKLDTHCRSKPIVVTRGQLLYEWAHLKAKLKVRDSERYGRFSTLVEPRAHPLLKVVTGDVEPWERVR
jgi:hypothetical protein